MSVERPESDVTIAIGMVGLVGLAVALATCMTFELSNISMVFLVFFGTSIPMIAWSLVVEKSYLRPSTGLDFSTERPWPEVISITKVKVAGLAASLALMFLCYFTFRHYQSEDFEILKFAFQAIAIIALVVSPWYIARTTRHMVEPKDELWHFGALVCLRFVEVDRSKIAEHLRAWTIKTFFLAFMVDILPKIVLGVTDFDFARVENPVAIMLDVFWLLYLIDITFGALGYLFAFRVLDSHIRTANPYLASWVAALACYPPFILFEAGGPLYYKAGTQEWHIWLAGNDVLLFAWGTAILALTAIYAWATVIFGLRFANLTNRGIITNGPFKYCRHPAYVAKCSSWWLIYMPFLSAAGPDEAVRNCLMLATVCVIYYLRAKTEEKHLMSDPKYRAYSEWIAQHGLLPRLAQKLGFRRRGLAGGSA